MPLQGGNGSGSSQGGGLRIFFFEACCAGPLEKDSRRCCEEDEGGGVGEVRAFDSAIHGSAAYSENKLIVTSSSGDPLTSSSSSTGLDRTAYIASNDALEENEEGLNIADTPRLLGSKSMQRKIAPDVEAAECYGVDLAAMRALKVKFPESPPAEIARYLARASTNSCPIKAAPSISAYLEWRRTELANWPAAPQILPLHMQLHGKARDGTRLLHFLSCTVDPALSPQVTGQLMLKWLDTALPRHSMDRLTVLFDVREHHGLGKNRNVFDVWRHAFALPKLFQRYFPERVSRVIIYPVDEKARTAWRFLRHIVSPATSKRIVLIGGCSKLGSPCPREVLEYFDMQEISVESHRLF